MVYPGTKSKPDRFLAVPTFDNEHEFSYSQRCADVLWCGGGEALKRGESAIHHSLFVCSQRCSLR
jgi:hypothetical protein